MGTVRTRHNMDDSTSSFSFNSMVRGYHVYNDIWGATEGELLLCTREVRDPFAVAVKNVSTTVGHVPRKVLLYVLAKTRGICDV